MSEVLFDLEHEYDAMLNQGIRLSGEDRDFFVAGRIQDLKAQLPRSPRRILDFGCGTGNASNYLSRTFPGAQVVGIDTSARALAYAEEHFASRNIRFETVADFRARDEFDLCYTNGVFHHIEPAERPGALGAIRGALQPGGYFALFENNPWNPGTRVVMSRIPFDRDAQTLTPPDAKRLLTDNGFEAKLPVRSLFYFPRFLSGLRFLEPSLARLPLGAQYYVLAQK